MNGLNPQLLNMARYRTKVGFVPSDATAGGGPPGGGMPPPPGSDPGGMPPPPPPPGAGMPPDMGGGMPPPPPPPDMGGGMPPPPPDMGGGGMDPAGLAAQVSQGVQQALAMSGLKGNVGPGNKPGAPKPDINTIATDVFQLKKMLFAIMRHQQIELPPDVLDGPNRDPMTGAAAASPDGGSSVQPGASLQPDGGESAISPIQPVQGAFPSGGMGKTSWAREIPFTARVGQEVTGRQFLSKAAAVARMCRRRREAC